MSSVLSRYPGRAIAVSFGLMLFTLTSLRPLLAQAPPGPQAMGSPFSLGVHHDITLVPTEEQAQRGASYVKRNFEA